MFKSKLRTAMIGIVVIALLVGGCNVLFSQRQPSIDHLALGNPSQATANRASADDYLLQKPQYVLSYNHSKGIPNWVSWHLDQRWLGDVERQDDFRPDDTLPQTWEPITPTDYTKSGYDRGHMTPSGDRTNTEANNSATFLMTNIVPQRPDNNRGPWVDLENYCRDLVEAGQELYIIAGGYGERRAIAEGKIIPPRHLWKIVVVLDQPGQAVGGVTTQSRVIAIDMPNRQGIRSQDWQQFLVSIDSIEAETGYDFLSNVPESVQQVIEASIDLGV